MIELDNIPCNIGKGFGSRLENPVALDSANSQQFKSVSVSQDKKERVGFCQLQINFSLLNVSGFVLHRRLADITSGT